MSDATSNDPGWDDALDPQLEEQLERQIARLRSLTEQARESISEPEAGADLGTAGSGTEGDADMPPAVADGSPVGSAEDESTGARGDAPDSPADPSGPDPQLESTHAGDAELRPIGPVQQPAADEVYAPSADDMSIGDPEEEPPWPDEPGAQPDRSRDSGGSWDPDEGAELAPSAGVATVTASAGGDARLLAEELWSDTQTAIAQLRDTAEELRQLVRDGGVSTTAGEPADSAGIEAIEAAIGRAESAVERLGRQLPRELGTTVQSEVSSLASEVRSSVGKIGTNLEIGLSKVERGLKEDVSRHGDVLGESLTRMERDVRQQVDHLEDVVRVEVERLSDTVNKELDAPAIAVRSLQSDLSSHTRRVEEAIRDSNVGQSVKDLSELIERQQALLDELQSRVELQRDELGRLESNLGNRMRSAVRDEIDGTRKAVTRLDEMNIGGALADVAEANIASLERLSELTELSGRERLQRVQDLEQLLDTMTEGWSGLYQGMERVVKKVDSIDARVDTFEKTIESMVDLEAALQRAMDTMESQFTANMGQMSDHLRSLQPAPVVVTVDHPNATVENLTKSGFTSGKE